MDRVIDSVVQIVVTVTLPPLLLGIINKVKATFAGRVGPPVLQLYYDLFKLFQKGSVFSTTTSWVFRAGPVVSLAALALASLFMPFGETGSPLSFTGDLILVAYLFGLARFFTASAALDTGSPFEGMGAVREVTFACLAEPAFFFGLVVLTKTSGSLTLTQMFSSSLLMKGWINAAPALTLVILSWFIVLLAENCRIPFDDPNTHLELTMIHEVMVLDHSGPAFGMILYAASIKLFLFCGLIVRLAVPFDVALPVHWLLFLSGIVILAALVGVIESIMARLRLVYVPHLLVAASLLSAFGIVLLVRGD